MTPEQAAILRKPFEPQQIGKLPKPYKKDSPKSNCRECGGYHGQPAVHLDYVGHAATTDRLLQVDPEWSWEPMAYDMGGLPLFDGNRNLWIKLTVCGVTRIGVGDGASLKECIGDCLVRDTPITTARGVVPIQEVRVGDMVPTRQGWRPVTDAWMSHPAAPVMTITFADSRTITGTPHHKVPTNNGVKRIAELRRGDTLYVWPDTASSLVLKRSSGTVGGSGDSQSTPAGAAGSTSWRPQRRGSTSTALSTSSMSDPSLPDGTSITKTTTQTTTIRRTLRRSHHLSTQGTTAHGILLWFTSVLGVAMSLLATVLGRNGAAAPAKSNSAVMPGWSRRDRAKAHSLSRGRASTAGLSTERPSHGNDSARLRVSSVGCAGTGEVWNLSVGEVHEYVANGVFVHNSIRNAAMRFGVALDLWAKEDLHTAAVERGSEATSETPSTDITPKQLTAIHTGMGKAGLAERVAGLAFLSEVTGREVTTSKTLSKTEAVKVLNQLAEINQGITEPQSEEPS